MHAAQTYREQLLADRLAGGGKALAGGLPSRRAAARATSRWWPSPKRSRLRLRRCCRAWVCYDLGENRPQELWRKAAMPCRATVRWHLIGHLQRNKIERTLPLVRTHPFGG